MTECFTLTFSEDATLGLHRRNIGDLDTQHDWVGLAATHFSPDARAYAQRVWTNHAYSEFCAAPLMAHFGQAMAACSAPMNWISLAFQLCAQELRHAELCGRVAATLGAVSHVPMQLSDMSVPLDPKLSPRQRANALALMLNCISETVSLRYVQCLHRSCTTPQLKEVWKSIVKDEAIHSRLGWMYLEWASDTFGPGERERLAAMARTTLHSLRTFYDVPDPLTPAELHACGSSSREERLAAFTLACEHDISPRLANLNIAV